MEGWTKLIEGILDRAPTRAMSLSRLLDALREEGAEVAGREDWILKRMAEQPESFRVIPDRLGSWVPWPGGKRDGTPARHPRKPGSDPWIMTCSAAACSPTAQRKFVVRVQESLQAWGREMDEGSQVAVARWIGANREAEKVFGKVLREESGQGQKPLSTSHPLGRPPQR